MKKVIILLLMGLFLFPAMELLAQQQVQSQTQIQELTKKQIRKMKRDQRRHARQVANMHAFSARVHAVIKSERLLI